MRFSKSLIILALSAGLAACGDSDKSSDNMDEALEEMTMEMGEMATNHQFMVEVVNLTAAQPFSPVAVIAHTEGMLWQIGILFMDLRQILQGVGFHCYNIAFS